MECSQKWPFLFLLHALLLASSTNLFLVSAQQKGDPLIQATCKRTSNYQLCISTLKSDPRSSNADAKGLAQISLEKLLAKTNTTLNFVGDLLRRTSAGSALYRSLGTCVDQYNGAVTENLPAAVSALNSNNYGASKQGVETTRNGALECEALFASNDPVTIQSKQVENLSVVTSEIISTLG
ncbi:hypothetical protein U1Q18_015868 [Sarracenia purpurea var. burkii]